jgi:hypothetical protein
MVTTPPELMGVKKTLSPNLFSILRDPMVHEISTLPIEAIQPSDSTSQGLLARRPDILSLELKSYEPIQSPSPFGTIERF